MRRFELVEGTSAKFWMGDVEGSTFVVVFGRLGTAGQRKEKGFPTADAAKRELDKKIAEKLREGYQEVSAGAAAAAPAAQEVKGAAAASQKLELPARLAVKAPTKAAIEEAAAALRSLEAAVGKRSWVRARQARAARRALGRVAGIDPASSGVLSPVFQSLMTRVLAPKPADRLPLSSAMGLLAELDAAAFERAVLSLWSDPPAESPAKGAVTVLAKQLAELEDAELALRVGSLLVDRPDRGSASGEAGFTLRWKALAPHLEAYLAKKGGSLKAYLKGIDPGGDALIAKRISRMLAA